MDSTLGTASASPVAILGAIVSATLELCPPLGARGDNAESKPLGPIFGFPYPIGMVIIGHNGGCGAGMLDREGGVAGKSHGP